MKTLLATLLAVLLCGSAFAATFQETKQATITILAKGKAQIWVPNKQQGTGERFKVTLLEYITVLGNAGDAKSAAAWKAADSLEKITTALRTLRTDVAALPATAETKTFLTRDLDPALAALDAVQKNPAGRTHAHAEALARLAAALEVK